MWSSWNNRLLALAMLLVAVLAGGCIADGADDSDLPWASHGGWEGMTPLPSSVLHQYD